jgi:pimeloyl-ACP methyl ester carboxylesterase
LPTVNIDGLRVAYLEAGRGLPIVMAPGLTGSKEWFTYQFSGLSENYRILSYDVRPARGRSYTLELLAEDLAKFLSAMRIPSAIIGGHSFGALIAQQFAKSFPNRTRGLILVSAFASLPREPQATIQKWLTPGDIHTPSGIGSLFSRLFCRNRPEEPGDGELAFLAANNAGLTKATLNERLRIVRESDLRENLPELGMPALVMMGARDRPEMLAAGQELYESLPNASLEVIENAGHFCFYERHDLFNNALDYFLFERLASLS